MKLSLTSVAVLALTSQSAVAWSNYAGRSAVRSSISRQYAAAALFSVSTEQSGETGTESFRLNFKGEVSVTDFLA